MCRFADVERAGYLVGDEGYAGYYLCHQGTEFARVVLRLGQCQIGLELEKVHLMLFHIAAEVLGIVLAGKTVGVVPVGQEQYLHVHACRQKHVRTSLGCMYAGIVTVVKQGDVVGKAVQEMYLLLGQGGARVGYHILYATLVHGDNIGVAFYHIHLIHLDDRLLGLVETVQLASFAIDAGFGRVLVLDGHALGGGIQDTSAKACHLAAYGVPWEHDTSPETVNNRAVLALDGKSCAHEVLFAIALFQCGTAHGVSSFGTETQLELLYDIVAETTFTEIGKSNGTSVHGVVHLVLEPFERPFVQDEHALALRLCGTLLGGKFLFLHLYAVFLGQIAKRIGIGQLLVLHDEADGIASLTTGKALAIILGRGNHERWRAVVMEWAEAFIVGTRLFQRDEIRHHIYYLCCLLYLVCGNPVYHIQCKVRHFCERM